VVFRAANDDAEIRLVAREAELRTNLKDQTLSIFLTDGTIEADNQVSMTDPETFEQVIPLQDATRRERRALSPSEVAFQDISQEVLQQRQSLHTLEQQMAAQAAFAMVLGDFPSLADRSWQAWQQQHADSASRLNRLQLEPWRRLAEGFSCLFFVLVGAPLAIRMRSANLFTTFAACFVPILFVYYPLLTYAVERAKEGMAPPYAVWSGNGVLLCAGLWLMRRVVRY
jgi:lipopolysaccharide export system permease protein